MITDTGMRDLVVGQGLVRIRDGELFTLVLDPRVKKSELPNQPTRFLLHAVHVAHAVGSPALIAVPPDAFDGPTFDALRTQYRLAVPDQRIFEGLYRHRDGGPDDVYWVHGVGVMDEDGHGNPEAPRQVCYSGTRLVNATGVPLRNFRSEVEFGQLVRGWPDGIIRPRFVRIEYKPKA